MCENKGDKLVAIVSEVIVVVLLAALILARLGVISW